MTHHIRASDGDAAQMRPERRHSVRRLPTASMSVFRNPHPHLLKNGHPAHVFTTEERRKGAAATNAIKRMRRHAAADEKFERSVAELIARDEARRLRKREKQCVWRQRKQDEERREREREWAESGPPTRQAGDLTEPDRIAIWLERGYGRRV
jgi:hypothetical protein